MGQKQSAATRPAQRAPGRAGQRPAVTHPAAGQETGAAPLVDAWRALSANYAAVCSALERELGGKHGLGVSEFEVLDRLVEDERHRFRAQELADAVHITQSTLSRLIGRLEQHGLVHRAACDLDRRGIYVCLTEAGRRRHAEAAATQRAVLADTLPARPAGVG